MASVGQSVVSRLASGRDLYIMPDGELRIGFFEYQIKEHRAVRVVLNDPFGLESLIARGVISESRAFSGDYGTSLLSVMFVYDLTTRQEELLDAIAVAMRPQRVLVERSHEVRGSTERVIAGGDFRASSLNQIEVALKPSTPLRGRESRTRRRNSPNMIDRINPYTEPAPWTRRRGEFRNYLYFLFDQDGGWLHAGADHPSELQAVQRRLPWRTEIVSLADLGDMGIDPEDPQAWTPRANRANSRSAWEGAIDAFETSTDPTGDPAYKWFVVYENTPTGEVIASGWEYRQDAVDAAQEGEAPRVPGWSAPVVRSRRWLMQHGVNPDLQKRWLQSNLLYSGTGPRQNRGPSRERIERLYEDFNHHAPKEWRDLKDVVKGVRLPPRVSPRGGIARIWYNSDKLMESGDRVNKPHDYVHCVLSQPDPRAGDNQCVCGHPLSDHEKTSEFATVYEGSTTKSGLAVDWPEAVAFLGWSIGWDEYDGDKIKPVRFKKKALITFAPDLRTIIVVTGNKAYLITGGEMKITPDGIAG